MRSQSKSPSLEIDDFGGKMSAGVTILVSRVKILQADKEKLRGALKQCQTKLSQVSGRPIAEALEIIQTILKDIPE